jgi:hypothetical protein
MSFDCQIFVDGVVTMSSRGVEHEVRCGLAGDSMSALSLVNYVGQRLPSTGAGNVLVEQSQCRLGDARPALAPGTYQPSHSDADGVERNHWGGEEAHVEDVGGGCDDCRNNKDDEYGVP